MQGRMMSGLSATGSAHARMLRFWALVATATIWTYGPSVGLPGEPQSDKPVYIRCPRCREPAKRQSNELYKCRKHHISQIKPDGSIESGGDDTPRSGSGR
jgi:hypothetical protein